MNDIFLQLVLFILGIVIGFGSQLATKIWLKRAVLVSGALAMIISAVWGGYILGEQKSESSKNEVSPSASCDDYGIRIVSPQDGDQVPEKFQVAGTYQQQPPEGRLVIYLSPKDGKTFWPDSIAQYNTDNKTWNGDAWLLGNNVPIDGYILVALVGESGRTLYDYYWKVGRTSDRWVSLDKLTEDAVICAKVYIRRSN
jgi:hypothetical protein